MHLYPFSIGEASNMQARTLSARSHSAALKGESVRCALPRKEFRGLPARIPLQVAPHSVDLLPFLSRTDQKAETAYQELVKSSSSNKLAVQQHSHPAVTHSARLLRLHIARVRHRYSRTAVDRPHRPNLPRK